MSSTMTLALVGLAGMSTAVEPPPGAAHLAVARAANGTREPSDFGDLTCMRWTGGSCVISGCASERGPTQCEEGWCMCAGGYCANAEGKCDQYPGEWLGDHALAFTNAYQPEKPYVQAQPLDVGLFFDAEGRKAQTAGVSQGLAASADPGKYWKVALTGHGHVRLESNAAPGHILSIYHVRRRRTDNFVQLRKKRGGAAAPAHLDVHAEDPHESEKAQARLRLGEHPLQPPETTTLAAFFTASNSAAAGRVQISDDDDLWPVLLRFPQAHPLDASFRLRQTMQDGGGVELWDPQMQVALSSASPDWLMSDRIASQGVAECTAPGLLFGGQCEGRQHVRFEPPLPTKAITIGPRDEILEVGSIGFIEALIIFALIVVCCLGACAVAGKGTAD